MHCDCAYKEKVVITLKKCVVRNTDVILAISKEFYVSTVFLVSVVKYHLEFSSFLLPSQTLPILKKGKRFQFLSYVFTQNVNVI